MEVEDKRSKYREVPHIKTKSWGTLTGEHIGKSIGSPTAVERKQIMNEALNLDGTAGENYSPLHKGMKTVFCDGEVVLHDEP